MSCPEPERPPTIALSADVTIDFHPGAGPVWWATLYTGPHPTEIGTVHGPDDLATILTLAAGVLMERPVWATRTYRTADGDRWVLVGRWVLDARLRAEPGAHLELDTAAQAAAVFDARCER